jgi:Ca2+-transporting ATPase
MTFATMVMAEVLRAHSDRSLRHSLIALGPLANRTLLWASGASIGLLLLVLYLPSLQSLFGLVSLGSEEWLLVLALAAVPLLGTEIAKTIHK